MTTPMTTDALIEQYNRAFVEHDPSLLDGLVADDCVMEGIEPAPDGTTVVGGEACLAFWQALAADRLTSFTPEDVVVIDDRAIIRWRYRFGPTHAESVRGVNLMQVRGGQIVEALGYVKSGEAVL
jgi:ketosteroid isomerase-like protein